MQWQIQNGERHANGDEAEIIRAKSIEALGAEITALQTEIQSLRQDNLQP